MLTKNPLTIVCCLMIPIEPEIDSKISGDIQGIIVWHYYTIMIIKREGTILDSFGPVCLVDRAVVPVLRVIMNRVTFSLIEIPVSNKVLILIDSDIS